MRLRSFSLPFSLRTVFFRARECVAVFFFLRSFFIRHGVTITLEYQNRNHFNLTLRRIKKSQEKYPATFPPRFFFLYQFCMGIIIFVLFHYFFWRFVFRTLGIITFPSLFFIFSLPPCSYAYYTLCIPNVYSRSTYPNRVGIYYHDLEYKLMNQSRTNVWNTQKIRGWFFNCVKTAKQNQLVFSK